MTISIVHRRPRHIIALCCLAFAALAASPGWAQELPPNVPAEFTPDKVIEAPITVDNAPSFHVTMRSLGGAPPEGGAPRDGCPPVQITHSSINFDSLGGQSLSPEAGLVETEIGAATYTVPANQFPVIINTMEMVFVQVQSTVTTTTHWSVLIWQGTPASGTLVDTFSSDGDIIPHIVLQPSSQVTAVDVTLTIDPGDPDQVVVQDNGTHSFSIGFRVDQHNQPASSSCCYGLIPQACCPAGDPPMDALCQATRPGYNNAFPSVDGNGAQHNAQNWLYCRPGCGSYACPGGWHDNNYVGMMGDWNIRATYTPFDCPGYGACCLTGGTCQVQTQADCGTAGGTWQGEGTSCSPNPCPQPTGACCHADGTCSENIQPANCQGTGESFYPDTTCANVPGGCPQPVGKCCLNHAPGCIVTTYDDCVNNPNYLGVWGGAFTDCSDSCVAACCFSGGSCLSRSWKDCTSYGGTWQGLGTACVGSVCPSGACCLPDGTCLASKTPVQCAQAGGNWQGNGVTCAAANCPLPVGACCFSNGYCDLLVQADCLLVPGTSWKGLGTDCSDNNQNGQADVCEPCQGVLLGDYAAPLGIVDGLDIQSFVSALLASNPTQDQICRGDFNHNGVLDTGDIQGMVNALLGVP